MSFSILGNHSVVTALPKAPIHVMEVQGSHGVVTYATDASLSLTYLDSGDWSTQEGSTASFATLDSTVKSGFRSVQDILDPSIRWVVGASADATDLTIDLIEMDGTTAGAQHFANTYTGAFSGSEIVEATYPTQAGVVAVVRQPDGTATLRAFSYTDLGAQSSVLETTTTQQTVNHGTTFSADAVFYASIDNVYSADISGSDISLEYLFADVAADTLSLTATVNTTVAASPARLGQIRARNMVGLSDVAVGTVFSDGSFPRLLLTNANGTSFTSTTINTSVADTGAPLQPLGWWRTNGDTIVAQVPSFDFQADINTAAYTVRGSTTTFVAKQGVTVNFASDTTVTLGSIAANTNVGGQSISADGAAFSDFTDMGSVGYVPTSVYNIQNVTEPNLCWASGSLSVGTRTISLLNLTSAPSLLPTGSEGELEFNGDLTGPDPGVWTLTGSNNIIVGPDGVTQNAVEFEGGSPSNWTRVSGLTPVLTTAFGWTITFWAKYSNKLGGNQRFVTLDLNAGGDSWFYTENIGSTDLGAFFFDGASSFTRVTLGALPDTDTWNHFAIVMPAITSGGTKVQDVMTAYSNGVVVGDLAPVDINGGATYGPGDSNYGTVATSNYILGLLDNSDRAISGIRIWPDKELTAEEVQAVYDSESS